MSTISTQLNWGSSYVVDDVYRRFIAPDKDEHHYVTVGRMSTILLIVLASIISLWLENAFQAFQILLQIGAGTGLIFLLRWFWWRINAWSEISAMIISFLVAIYFQFVHEAIGFPALHPSVMLISGIAVTTAVWLVVTFATSPTDKATLQAFYDRIHPFGRGWSNVVSTKPRDRDESLSAALLCWFLGCVVVYGSLFGTGFFIYGDTIPGAGCTLLVLLAVTGLFKALPKVGFK
jgi:Na+/proline symporter